MDSGPDLHVVALRYSLQSSDRVTYVSPPAVEFETEEARLELVAGKLTCDMKLHFPSAEAARAVIEPILRAWEVAADLRSTQEGLRFKFDGADIVDRSPVPAGVIRGQGILMSGVVSIIGVGTASVHVTYPHYPEPPSTFRLNPNAETIFLRYKGYLAGREPLLSMAYFCLTVLEVDAGGRAAAAMAHRIEVAVLRKMGELTTCRGDRSTARKATSGPVQELTGPEGAWLEAAVKALIWRLGDTRDGAALPLISLADLPGL